MLCRELQRCSRGPPIGIDETAPKHPSVWAPVGSGDSKTLQVMEQIHRSEYSVASSMFTHVEQEDFMMDLWWELSGCMTRTGLQRKKGPTELPSRNWRHYQGSAEGDQACEGEW